MSEKKISYLNRTFADYKEALIDFAKKYYPNLATSYDDASVGSFIIDINAATADALGYYVDRAYQETNIESANERASLYALARNNGLKTPGPKGAMAEVQFSCQLPKNSDGTVDFTYAPVVRRGTKVSAGSQVFELLTDVDFSKQFSEEGTSDRTIYPMLDSNGVIQQYKVTKLAVVVAGESKVYKKVVYMKDVVPFMEILLPEKNIMNVESIIVKDGTNIVSTPTYSEFYMESESGCTDATKGKVIRFFEADSLAQQYRWGDEEENGKALSSTYKDKNGNEVYYITKGKWHRLEHKFITEYTDNGYLKVIFGSGTDEKNTSVLDGASAFSKFQIERVIKNDSLGILPNADTTVFVLYRVGGGKSSNVAKGAINYINYLNAEIPGGNASMKSQVARSITVISTTPSVSGKDMPTANELRYLIKYNNGSQDRCVTVKDYIHRILMMPSRYGCPFRVGVSEENNKIMVNLLGLNADGQLDTAMPALLIHNIREYLANYRMINDYIEIKPGKIVNISFDIDVYVDKNYNKSDVISAIINKVYDYMDINAHNMGDDIFVGDIEKEISKIDGVINLIDLQVWNEYGNGYSETRTTQEIESTNVANRSKIDLEASEGILYSDGDTMLEIKTLQDVRVRCKTR